jgi:hypothetical protein
VFKCNKRNGTRQKIIKDLVPCWRGILKSLDAIRSKALLKLILSRYAPLQDVFIYFTGFGIYFTQDVAYISQRMWHILPFKVSMRINMRNAHVLTGL